MQKVRIKCPACGGTCIYHGFQEKHGVAVPCNKCKGKGYQTPELFTEIVPRDDIEFVNVDGKLMPYKNYVTEQARKNAEASD